MNDEPDVVVLARKLRYDLTEMQAKVTDLLKMLAALNLPDPSVLVCPECELTFRSEHKLAEHRFQSHDGPVPEHYVEAESRALEPVVYPEHVGGRSS